MAESCVTACAVCFTKFLSMATSRIQIFHKVAWQHVPGLVGFLMITAANLLLSLPVKEF